MSRRYLLSIDGGGIRGIIPALALLKLEQNMKRPAREVFSFAAGTSTGALLASAVAAGIPAQHIVDIYKNRIKDIFKPGKPWSDMRRYTIGHKYDIGNLNKVLCQEFGTQVGWKLNDSPIDILLTAKGLDGKAWYFVRDNPANAQTTGGLGLLDCATASAAAPTYFNPWPMSKPVDGKVVDGGVGVTGNPVYQACIEAFCYCPDYNPVETTVISFGTGRTAPAEADPHLITGWLNWVVDELLSSPEEQQTQIVARHYTEVVFYRLQPKLTENIDMDEVERIGDLEEMGQQFAEQVDWDAMLRGDETPFRVKPPGCDASSGG